jgi:hypothetical protein
MAPPRPPPYLSPEIVEEILLRVSPEDPAGLVRAYLACKPWRRFLCDPAFRRRYLAFHQRTPPLLGFLHNRWRDTRGDGDDSVVPGFFATTTPSPFPKQAFDGCASRWCVVDCRHGRVLFGASSDMCLLLVVWDPTTGKRKWLPTPPTCFCWSYAAAVLCALHGHGCDHLECCSGPFFVVLVESGVGSSVRVHLYSSEAGSWNTSPDHVSGFNVNSNRSALIGNDIYFVSAFGSRDKILRYNLGNNHLSFLQAPAADKISGGCFLVPMEDGLLGLGTILGGTKLCLWLRNVDPDVVAEAGWVQCRTIELQKLIPISTYDLEVVGSADDFGIIFVATVSGVFAIDLKSSRARKVGDTMKCFKIFPFMTFYTPDSRYCASTNM